jgi:CspA family cold shock protein
MNRQQGTVKWFSRDKGWGFVRLEDGSEIFVHHSDIEGEGHKTLQDDEPVEFSVEEMEKGPRAREVRRLNASGKSTSAAPKTRGRNRRASEVREPAKTHDPSKPVPLAEQLRKRLSRLFPGIGG